MTKLPIGIMGHIMKSIEFTTVKVGKIGKMYSFLEMVSVWYFALRALRVLNTSESETYLGDVICVSGSNKLEPQ